MSEINGVNLYESPGNVRLETATDADANLYLEISSGLISRTYSGYEDIDEVIELIHKGIVYRIVSSDAVVGFISLENKGDGSVELDNLMIKKEWQGMGFGDVALRQVLEEIGKSKTVTLVTHPDNVSALKIYMSVGFVEIERKENYFGDGEPRLVLIRNGLTK